MTRRSFLVSLRFQFPAWDEVEGIRYEVEAESKSQAIEIARRRARRDGHTGQGASKGRVTFKAFDPSK